jgi:hypothetical protein
MPTRRVPGSSVSFREGLDVVLEEVLVPLVVVLEEVVELVDTGAGESVGPTSTDRTHAVRRVAVSAAVVSTRTRRTSSPFVGRVHPLRSGPSTKGGWAASCLSV